VAELDNGHTDDTNSENYPPTPQEMSTESEEQPEDQTTATLEKVEKALVPNGKTVEKETESPRLPIDFNSILSQTKWCKTCQCWKPDRSHHCSICDECVLKMDQ
jgi:hypothetical protein